jgi:hypothetical protein
MKRFSLNNLFRQNLDYARRALTSLEQDALAMKAPGRRAEAQTDLNNKREALNLLFERLEDLKQVGKTVSGIECAVANSDLVGRHR